MENILVSIKLEFSLLEPMQPNFVSECVLHF